MSLCLVHPHLRLFPKQSVSHLGRWQWNSISSLTFGKLTLFGGLSNAKVLQMKGIHGPQVYACLQPALGSELAVISILHQQRKHVAHEVLLSDYNSH